jgi:hypothetical protein
VTVRSAYRRVSSSSLLLRFGIFSAALIAGLGVVLGGVLEASVESRALVQAERMAATLSDVSIQPLLGWEDFADGEVRAGRAEQLDAHMDAMVAAGTVARVKLFNDQGSVLYATDGGLMGQQVEVAGSLATALGGDVDSALEPLPTP